jgi:hypothetical protein
MRCHCNSPSSLDSLRIQRTAYQRELVDDIGPNVAAGAIAVAPFGKPAAIKRGCLIWVDAEGRVTRPRLS